MRRIPSGARTRLSNPRGTTTTMPDRRILGSIPGRADRVYARPVDRGALVPVAGQRQRVPGTTDPGGVPRGAFWPGTFFPQLYKGKDVAKLTATAAQRTTFNVKQVRNAELYRQKPTIVIVPGPSGELYAKGPRIVPGTPNGVRGALRDFRPRTERGVFAQQYTVPDFVGKRG